MTEGQIGILVSVAAIIAVAVGLWRQKALGTTPLAVVVASAVGIAALLVTTF